MLTNKQLLCTTIFFLIKCEICHIIPKPRNLRGTPLAIDTNLVPFFIGSVHNSDLTDSVMLSLSEC